MKKQWTTIVAIILMVIVSFFAISNMENVPVNFMFKTVTWPLIMVILGSLLLGALIAVLISTGSMYRNRKQIKQSERKVVDIQAKSKEDLDQNRKEMQQMMESQLRDKNEKIAALEEEIRQLKGTAKM
ncbi:LapA family protein [Pisciglobus halotolerans]|uniref:Uncharacterized integral membrane protein n=1 Tax=Pisciglobus halotolerans TaxID=745365 RepID=A0A1I3E1E3_9LACT|nr:lipopolysaccharide assembly protein LapA domain-containing protein [Pisciglobus halotolerans]SFH92511.1 Uncharacterized integral membrane protein [Pisciglobus halotolerans]